jgi:hypothetical protein
LASKPFPAPLGNLNWVQTGENAAAPDGYLYAIATDREFNASSLVLGRTRPDPADVTDPSRWQWATSLVVSGSRTGTSGSEGSGVARRRTYPPEGVTTPSWLLVDHNGSVG